MGGIFEDDIPEATSFAGLPESPSYYSPDADSVTHGGATGKNITPASDGIFASAGSYVSDLTNKVLGSDLTKQFISTLAKERFGRSTLPQTAQGGKTQGTTGVLNPVPMNWLKYPYQSSAQPNETLDGPFKFSGGIMIAIAAVVLLLIFARR